MSTVRNTLRRLGSVLTAPDPRPSPHYRAPARRRTDTRCIAAWPAPGAAQRLGQVSGVGVDSIGDVFVLHRAGRVWREPFPPHAIEGDTVLQLDGRTGAALASWGHRSFWMPHGLRVDIRDNVWVTDLGRQQVIKFAHDGAVLLTVGEQGVAGCDATHFASPTDVAVSADGSFYVTDGYVNSRVARFSPTGELVSEWGRHGTRPGELRLPHGIAVDADGLVYVADRGNSRIQVFGPEGEFVMQWRNPELGRPYGISIARDGRIFSVDGDGSRLLELDRGGRVLNAFDAAAAGCRLAHSVTARAGEFVYVGDLSGGRVQKWAVPVSRRLIQ
ncbi:MAG: peptidyl-alpha-hydroxyglycine alpha-amidating lyase family protein [Acidobacteriota bacterium]|nr:peptidyl-alpha-hydroxyglycine alpha-amidating lyase family protein [Acidobacteriota bacterium]